MEKALRNVLKSVFVSSNLSKMKFNKLLIATFCYSVFFSYGRKEVPPPQALLPVPSAAQMAWHEMETNAFIHYTTNTFTGLEWGYGESPGIFNPSDRMQINRHQF